MKKVMMYLLACTSMLISTLAFAEDSPHEFSANVTYTTDYMFRGISQSSEQSAIQGGFDYSYATGGFADIYLGTWASSVEFGDDDTTSEVDWYGGLIGELSSGISWDVGGLYYMYPGTDADASAEFDYVEVYGNLGYTFANVGTLEPTIGVGIAYSPEYFGEDGDSVYVSGALDLSLPMGFGLSFLVGYLDVEGGKTTGPAGYDFTHYVVGVNKSLSIFDFDVSYYDTSDETDCGGEICEAVVFTVASSF
jgi:uncharacterized protein (TIGR02001 family)